MARLTISYIILKPKEMLPNYPVIISVDLQISFSLLLYKWIKEKVWRKRIVDLQVTSDFCSRNFRSWKTNSLIFSLFLLLQGIHALEISLLCNKMGHRKLLKNMKEGDDCPLC